MNDIKAKRLEAMRQYSGDDGPFCGCDGCNQNRLTAADGPLVALVEKWKQEARENEGEVPRSWVDEWERCANELEAALFTEEEGK